jgi:hypothetical protein
MTDLQALHDAWDRPAPPSPAVRAEARAALMQRAARRRRPHRRRALAAALAAAMAALAVVATDLGGSRPEVPIAYAEVLERAAAAAEQKPFTAPRAHQWIYMEDRFDDGATRVRWRRADGAGMAWIENGELRVEIMHADPRRGRPAKLIFDGYEKLAALPTDPDALLRWAYGEAKNITGAGLTEHGDVYAIFNGMLRDNVLPPELEAAIFRALKLVPGVRLEEADVLGRPAYSLGQTEDWLDEELLLDRKTYRYLGERSTVVRDATIDPLTAGNETGEVRRGDRVVAERIRTAIVDRPGERPH